MATTTIGAKKKDQLLQQRLREDAVEREPQEDFDTMKHLIERDVMAAPHMPYALRHRDYRALFVAQDFSFQQLECWLYEQKLALSLHFQGPANPGDPSLLSWIQVSFYDCREWTKADALQVKQ
jgi:hypothetical protein